MNKIISFSVWGDNPRYAYGAIKNAELAKKLLPDWRCLFYVDPFFKKTDELKSFDNVDLFVTEGSPDFMGEDFTTDRMIFGAFWRFLPMFESEDNVVLSRDADSRISEREVRCINEWLESNKKFSIIRDHPRHYDWPILAGMWGMRGKLNSNLLKIMNDYAHKNHFYSADQVYLRDHIWPIAKDDSFIHGYKEIEWMRESRPDVGKHFVGQGYLLNEITIFHEELGG